MTTTWLPGAHQTRDLSTFVTNGPFKPGGLWGVILHVNVDEHGTPITFWGPGNAMSVVPNFQVFKDGSFDQMLPMDRQPWCQIDGNFNYAAIETAGLPSEPLTDAQLATCARIMAVYHHDYGVPLTVANSPGQKGLGTHEMGGAAWGGHPCPGTIRAAQRQKILNLARHPEGDLSIVDKETKQYLDGQFAALEKSFNDRLDNVLQDYDGTPSRLRTYAKRIGANGYVEPTDIPKKDDH